MVPLKRIVVNDLTGIVTHPVVKKFIELKWRRFGLFHTIKETLVYLVFLILLGMSLGEFHNDDRHTFPSDRESVRRVIVDFLLVIFVFYYIGKEVNEAWTRTKDSRQYARNREEEILGFLEKSPKELRWHDTPYLESRLKEMRGYNYWLEYVKDPWNWLDWTCYGCLMAAFILRFARAEAPLEDKVVYDSDSTDTTSNSTEASSPPSNETALGPNSLKNISSSILNHALYSSGPLRAEDSSESSGSTGTPEPFDGHLTATYLMIAGVILAYVKLAWYGRSYERTGAFVVMLGRMANDVINFIILYSALVVPFSISFMVLFKGRQQDQTTDYVDVPNSIMTLFRMTLVDLDYSNLSVGEPTMAPLLVSLWLFISGILVLNLFIAMMSNTYQSVQDQAKVVALLERAATIVRIEEEEMGKKRLKKESQWILDYASADHPLEEPFNADYTHTRDSMDKLDVMENKIMKMIDSLNDKLERCHECELTGDEDGMEPLNAHGKAHLPHTDRKLIEKQKISEANSSRQNKGGTWVKADDTSTPENDAGKLHEEELPDSEAAPSPPGSAG
eukprot:Nk52_evm11s2325 gene=Nk52_evmTU11s2325